MRTRLRIAALVVIAVGVVEGFRLVTQSGLAGLDGSVQDDGYAVIGGILILLGGMAAGYLLAATNQRKGRK